MEESNLIGRLWALRRTIYAATGYRPRAFYLGHETLRQLKTQIHNTPEWTLINEIDGNGNRRAALFGIPIYIVDEGEYIDCH